MKKQLFTALCISCALLSSCTSDEPESATANVGIMADTTETESVTISFNAPQVTVTPMTRAASSIADICTHLDVWITDGTTTTAYNQATGDEGFGSLVLTLNNQQSYTLYAVAHRGSGAATLSDGIISFADDKVTHTFFYSTTFTPTKNLSINCEMSRIVAQFQFLTTDQVPDWCKTIRFTLSDVYDRWSVTDGATHQLDRISTFTGFSKHDDGTVGFNIYAIVSNTSTNHNILIEGLNADGEVKETHTLIDVPLRNNYRTVATGAFFTDAASTFSFKAADWADEIAYNF